MLLKSAFLTNLGIASIKLLAKKDILILFVKKKCDIDNCCERHLRECIENIIDANSEAIVPLLIKYLKMRKLNI